ncbi:MAG TPA: DNRLRE domain-containing protein [Spirochaetia bacterium]|nr:DNRLRE domain-containing protein [Spirochaetia bacterium]
MKRVLLFTVLALSAGLFSCDLLLAPMEEIREVSLDPVVDGYAENTPLEDFAGISMNVSTQTPMPYAIALIRFDLGPLPENARIISAELKLKCIGITDEEIVTVFRIDADWDPETINYVDAAKLGFIETDAEVPSTGIAMADLGSTISWQIKSIVQAWSDGAANRGVALKGSVLPIGPLTFSTMEGEQVPELIVKYDE